MNNEIYRLHSLEKTEDSLRATLEYDPGHAVFEGHFPGNPIVPGVCTLDMIADLVRLHIDGSYRLEGASNVKFLQLIRPADTPEVKLSWKSAPQGLQVTATLEQAGIVLVRFAGVFVSS